MHLMKHLNPLLSTMHATRTGLRLNQCLSFEDLGVTAWPMVQPLWRTKMILF